MEKQFDSELMYRGQASFNFLQQTCPFVTYVQQSENIFLCSTTKYFSAVIKIAFQPLLFGPTPDLEVRHLFLVFQRRGKKKFLAVTDSASCPSLKDEKGL